MKDYCPFDECPKKKEKIFICLRRYFSFIERYCPVFGFTEEEKREFFKEMEQQSSKYKRP
jgi:hypothetical protein